MSISFKPGQVCRWDPDRGFVFDGKPYYIVGINYVARYICTNFWEDWRPEVIAEDMDRIAASGLNAVRIPVQWESAEPAPGQFRPEMLERMNAFFEMAAARGLFVMPWFLVGVATNHYDISWRDNQGYFTDPMAAHAERHLRTLVGHLRHHPNVLCWDICDEPEYYSNQPGTDDLPYNSDRFQAWLDRLYRAIKEVDPEHAVMLGFGAFGGTDYGIDIRRAARTLDVMAVTAYTPNADEDFIHGVRSAYFISWNLRLNDCAGKGVFSCEAPGWSDVESSERNIAAFYRVVLSSQLANSSMGVLPWVWNDFDEEIAHLRPLDAWGAEVRFGIVRADGALKPAGEELRRFSDLIASYPPAEWRQVMPEVGVLMPMIDPRDAHHAFPSVFHHYILLRQAGLRARYVWIDDLDSFDGKLLFLPEAPATSLRTHDWQQLERWVSQGGMLVSSNRQRTHLFNRLFGVIAEGKKRCLQPLRLGNCAPELAASSEGTEFPAGRSYAVVSLNGATALATDQDGLPLVTLNRWGKGLAIYLPYAPEEAMLSLQAEQLAAHPAHVLYRDFASLAGLSFPVTCPDPRVELDARRDPDGRLLAIAVNHSRFATETVLECDGRQIPLRLEGSDAQWVDIA